MQRILISNLIKKKKSKNSKTKEKFRSINKYLNNFITNAKHLNLKIYLF